MSIGGLTKLCNQSFAIDPKGETSEVSAFGARPDVENTLNLSQENTLDVPTNG